MSKSTGNNLKTKRRLIDDFNRSKSPKQGETSKRMRIADGQNNRISENEVSSQELRPQGRSNYAGTTKIDRNNDLVVKIVTKNAGSRLVSKKTNSVQKGQNFDSTDHDKRKTKVKVKSKIVVPMKQTRSRMIKAPARFIESSLNVQNVSKGRKTLSKKDIDMQDFDHIDLQTNSEIVGGDTVALGRPQLVDHDGVELSINGSDLDEFSDEENRVENETLGNSNDQQSTGEPGEILSSGEEDAVSSVTKIVPPKVVSKTNRMDKFSHLKDDPDFNKFLDQMLDRKISDKTENFGRKKGMDNKNQNATVGAGMINFVNKQNDNVVHNRMGHNLVKSPSDTTLYTPGLKRVSADNPSDINAIEKISNFVENIRIGSGGSGVMTKRRIETNNRMPLTETPPASTSTSAKPASKRPIHDAHQKVVENNDDAELAADQLILQADKFKARVEAPKGIVNGMNDEFGMNGLNDRTTNQNKSSTGMLMPYDYERLRSKFITENGLAPIDSEILFLRNFDQDDEFFHVTSQIEPSIKTKIEKGEFVDLDKLLPKDKFSSGLRGNDELNKQLFQLITQGTSSYMGTSEHHRNANKVNSIKKWDQAFRVYAAIYTQANPSRAGEIWQYIYIIHTAATSNPWENVAFYDITFRELMASKPWRNWGKTYTQGWNMAFNNNHSYSHGMASGYGQNKNSHQNNGHQSNSKDWKDDCCWRFNKNKCKKKC